MVISSKRKRDPKALRSSKRSEARKYHNYSRKHHKDDDRTPGFEHKAGQFERRVAAVDTSEETAPKRRRLGKLRKQQAPMITPRSQDSVDVDNLVEETLSHLERVAPSTARVFMNSDEQINSVSSGEEDNESHRHGESNDLKAEEDPLPLFTNLEEDTNEHHSQSELPMPRSDQNGSSDDIDTALLNFIQVPTSDQIGAANVTTSNEPTPDAQDSNDVVEDVHYVSDAAHADSSHTLHGFVNSEEEGGQATSSTSPGLISKTVEDVVDEKVETNHEPESTEILHKDTETIDGLVLQSTKSGVNRNDDISDDKSKAALADGDIAQLASEIINTQHESLSTGKSKTSESSKTMVGDCAAEANGATEGDGPPSDGVVPDPRDTDGARQPQEAERVSVLGSEAPNEELMKAHIGTLQAMLEQEIATSQQIVANSSTSDMLM